jgi:hypothetical protein
MAKSAADLGAEAERLLLELTRQYHPAWYYQMAKEGYECSWCRAMLPDNRRFAEAPGHKPGCVLVKAHSWLKQVRANPDLREMVTYAQWDGLAARLERRNLRRYGKSLTRGSISAAVDGFVLEVREDEKVLVVRKGWRAAMRAAAEPEPDPVE